MSSIGDWIKILIVVVILGNLVEFVLPRGDLKRYGGLVVGLVVLATIITPLWGWMHDLGGHVTAIPQSWTNTASGFTEVVEQEEIHQAESIVLSMPHVMSCRLVSTSPNRVLADVTMSDETNSATVTKYIEAALQVTMSHTPHIALKLNEPTSKVPSEGHVQKQERE